MWARRSRQAARRQSFKHTLWSVLAWTTHTLWSLLPWDLVLGFFTQDHLLAALLLLLSTVRRGGTVHRWSDLVLRNPFRMEQCRDTPTGVNRVCKKMNFRSPMLYLTMTCCG